MQGRLKKPVSGTLAGLFGQDRGDGEVWKGVFYQTTPAAVSSIAAGTVTYADELQGFGKVIVIDHGDGYISIYSGLSENRSRQRLRRSRRQPFRRQRNPAFTAWKACIWKSATTGRQ